MNKEDSIKEKFKLALISTVRVISDDYKINNKDQNKSKEKLRKTNLIFVGFLCFCYVFLLLFWANYYN